MTVKQLKEILATVPDEIEVYMDERKTEFRFGLVNSAEVRNVSFSEEPDSDPICDNPCIVLSEE
jgi:hypothetical protein